MAVQCPKVATVRMDDRGARRVLLRRAAHGRTNAMEKSFLNDTANARATLDTVIFDLGNVLIDWNPRHLYRKLFVGAEEEMERFLTEVCSAEWNERQDAGRSWCDAIEEAVARHPHYAEHIRAYRDRWEEMLGGAVAETVQILDELRRAGTRLLALTNWSRETFPIALARFEFLRWFEGIVVSGQERLLKPDPAIYRRLIERYAVDVSRAVFIDDSPRNVEGARRVGLRAIHFKGAAELRRELNALGLPV